MTLAKARATLAKYPVPRYPNKYQYNPSNIVRQDRLIRAREEYRLLGNNPVNLGIQRRGVNPDAAFTAAEGLLGAASIYAPAIAPVAAVAGIGYGVYKLGESFKLW